MDSFRRIVHALRSSHRAATDVELTGAQLFVLTTLRAADGPMSVNDLAAGTRTDQSTVSVVAKRLIERGFIARKRAASDSRRAELTITARGRAVLRRMPATVAQTRLAEALASLSTADARALMRILARIVDHMGEAEAPARMLFSENERPRKKTRRQ